ncbi:hypothetical protein ACJJTC_000028 [Scirpophaga incertulas]
MDVPKQQRSRDHSAASRKSRSRSSSRLRCESPPKNGAGESLADQHQDQPSTTATMIATHIEVADVAAPPEGALSIARSEAALARIESAPAAGTARPEAAPRTAPPEAATVLARIDSAPANVHHGKVPAVITGKRKITPKPQPIVRPETPRSTAPPIGTKTNVAETPIKKTETPAYIKILPRPPATYGDMAAKNVIQQGQLQSTRDPRLQKNQQPSMDQLPIPKSQKERVRSPTPENPPVAPQPFPNLERVASREDLQNPRKRPPEEDISVHRPGTMPRLEIIPATPNKNKAKPTTERDAVLPRPPSRQPPVQPTPVQQQVSARAEKPNIAEPDVTPVVAAPARGTKAKPSEAIPVKETNEACGSIQQTIINLLMEAVATFQSGGSLIPVLIRGVTDLIRLLARPWTHNH